MSLYRVYIAQNAAGNFYIGISDNVRRVRQHEDGGSRWTKGRGPWACVWESKQLSLGEARKLENLLKRQKGGNGFYRFDWLGPSMTSRFKSRPRDQPYNSSKAACCLQSIAQSCRAKFRIVIHRSSVVERSAVNRLVVGSNPTAGAIPYCPGTTVSASHATKSATAAARCWKKLVAGAGFEPATFRL